MTPPELPAVAFIGLGNMGIPMATRLVDAGYPVVGHDLSQSALERLSRAGGRPAITAADAVAQADVLILMLPNSDVVESVLNGPDVAASLRLRTPVVIDMSSSEPLRTRTLSDALAAQGIHLVDAPVSGGVTGATAGTLTIMVGATDQLFDELTALLQVLGRPVHAGEVGAGHAAKALNNLLSATHLWVTSEAMIVGEQFGIDPTVLLSIFNGSSGRSGSTENKWPNFILTETYDSGFGLNLMLKDMRIAAGLADQVGLPSRLGERAIQLWAEASNDLPAGADHTEIARWLKQYGVVGAPAKGVQ